MTDTTGDLGFTVDVINVGGNGTLVDLDSISYLSIDLMETMPEWQYLQIVVMERRIDKNGNVFYSLFFVSKDNSYKIREFFFKPVDSLRPLVKALGMQSADSTKHFLQKWVWCKLSIRTSGEREYTCINGFSDKEPPVNEPMMGRGKKADKPNDGGDIPF